MINNMENPIKDNRIVNDITFAVRLCSFIKEVDVNDFMSEEEQEYLLRVAKKLITYQVQTADETSELDYIDRIRESSIEPNIIKPFITEDGYEVYEDSNVLLYSCLRNPTFNDENINYKSYQLFNGRLNKNRLFFFDESDRDKYIEDNLIQYSKKDLEKLIKTGINEK